MPQQAAAAVENNFKNGLLTEFSGLNFPESACTETYDCEFQFDGSVSRRKGFDFEKNATTKTIDRYGNIVQGYLWKNVAGNGDVSLYVVQVGPTLYFYDATGAAVSTGAITSSIDLNTYTTSASLLELEACQFSDGNGLLFVTHPYCDSFYVSYNSTTQVVTGTLITIKIRDFEGAPADPYTIDERPTATLSGLNVSHKYNLLNQGWTTTNLTTWDSAFTTMPSNSDVMWSFKNSSDAFDTATVPNAMRGNSPAPKGHFILTMSNQDRDTASGLSGVAATTTSFIRCSTSAFFAGRVFYSGINYVGFNSKIFFSQIVENTNQYGNCYQLNDPTSEDAFDLLPTDGGVISIPEAGTIFKLIPVTVGLIVFAANGLWLVTGSTGVGFTANDYAVTKIEAIQTLSPSSFVLVNGSPAWWNSHGIYILDTQQGSTTVKPLTDTTIASFYDDIPLSSKSQAKGYFNSVSKTIEWLYSSTESSTPTEISEYDRVLVFDIRTGAFYPWRISDTNVKVHGVFVKDTIQPALTKEDVKTGVSTLVVDLAGTQVIDYITSTAEATKTFKYLVSYKSGSSYKFTFAEVTDEDYVDWYSYDTIGENYMSYFITGYKIRGGALRKFQTNWVEIYSRLDNPVSYYFQGLWDFATSGNTGRWSLKQYLTHDEDSYANAHKRIKVRGHGTALQFKVTSVDGEPFDIIGWAELITGNAQP